MPGNVSLTGIEFTIKGSADSASASIDRLIGNLTQLNTALSKSSNFAKASSGLKSLGDALKGIGGIKALTASFALRELGKAAESLKGFKSAATAMKSISKIADNPEAIADTVTWLSRLATIDFSNIEQAASGIRSIAESAGAISNIKPVADTAQQGVKNIGEEARRQKNHLGEFASSILRIAKYRMIRAALKAVTQAFQEGLKNAYQFSKTIGGDLAQSLDNLATVSMTMKNQMGAAFGGLITAITPIVVQAIKLVTALASAITRLIAILGGHSTWMKAKDVWTEWGDAAAGAGGAAKEALRYLAPFDELNRLPDANKGGGGGGDLPNYEDMFEMVSTDIDDGLASALAETFGKIANFFEDTDWKGLADKAWEGLKTAFSDTGKASEVIRALFEALGAALGAGVAFVGEFTANIVRDLYASFKSNLKDYNGDGKISINEFLSAAFMTGMNIYNSIKEWVETNVVNPFMTGFSEALGYADVTQLEVAVKNIGIKIYNWFANNVFNPLIQGWNNLVNKMPQWLQDGLASLLGVDTLKIPLIAEVEEIDYNLVAAQKVIDGITAGIDKVSDKLPKDKKLLDAFTAGINNVKPDYNASGMSDAKRTITSTAKFAAVSSALTDSQTTLYTRARFNRVSSALTDSQRTVYTTSRFNAVSSALTANQKTIHTTSRFSSVSSALTDSQKTIYTQSRFNSVSSALTDSQKTIYTQSRFNSVSSALTDKQKTIGTSANFISSANGLKAEDTTFGSTALFNKYSVAKNVADGVNMQINATANITKTKGNVKGNLTISAQALGGVLKNGIWSSIPQYASGTTRAHGSLFVAGEAGPEVVGHIGGRTEVLNRSQLAATMYAAVRSAMVGTSFRMASAPSPNYSDEDGMNEDVLYRAFSRALADSDLGGDIQLDGNTLYRAMVNRNRQNTRLTGVNAMA